MASPAFGFSIGDCIAGVKLALDIYKACKEKGGAASKSQSTICELESYCTVLERVKDDFADWTSPESKTAASNLVSACRNPLEDFSDKFAKRWNEVACKQANRRLQSFYRNARWALSDADAVEELKAQLRLPINSLGLLVGLETRSSFHSTLYKQDIIIRNLIEETGKVKEGLSRIDEEMAKMNASQLQAITQIQAGQIWEMAPTSSQSLLHAPSSDSVSIDLRNRVRPANDSYARTQHDICLDRSTANRYISSVRVWLGNSIFFQVLRCLKEMSWDHLIEIVLQLLELLSILATRIYAAPTRLLSDNIIFTDFLGIEESLTYNDFCHWPTFMARLGRTFAKSASLFRGKVEFYVISKKRKPARIGPTNWAAFIHPCSKIIMVRRMCILKTVAKKPVLPECHYSTAVQPRIRNIESTNPEWITFEGKSKGAPIDDLRGAKNVTTPTSSVEGLFLDGKTAATLSGTDEMRRGEFDCYKYIRVQPWPAIRFQIPGFYRVIPESQRNVAKKILGAMEAIFDNSYTRGIVSFHRRESTSDLISLSDCSVDVKQRTEELQLGCNNSPLIAVSDTKRRATSHSARILYLVSIELNQYRLVEEKCEGCGSQHWFWFNAPSTVALTALERWRKWAESEPFTSHGVLTEDWQVKIDTQRRRFLLEEEQHQQHHVDDSFALAPWLDEVVSTW